MNNKYDLKAMLKEIEEDEKFDQKSKNMRISQNEIITMLKKKKKVKKSER